jgi:hypothetical protein
MKSPERQKWLATRLLFQKKGLLQEPFVTVPSAPSLRNGRIQGLFRPLSDKR